MSSGNLYEISQLCSTVETLSLGLALLFIGNGKVLQSPILKRVKVMLAAVLLLVGTTIGLQWLLRLSVINPIVDQALNITLVFTVTYLMCLAFLPIASRSYLTGSRLMILSVTFICLIIMLWVALLLFPTLSQIVLFTATALYIIELSHVTIVFFHNYRMLCNQRPEPGSNEYTRLHYIKQAVSSFVLLNVFAILYVIFVLLTQQFKAFYNLVVMLVWGYLFVSIVNSIIGDKTLINNELYNIPEGDADVEVQHGELTSRIDEWIERGGYRVAGITLTHVAQEMSTNTYHLTEYITSRYGCNFKSWITGLRVNYARHLLETTSISIDMVASRSGFSNKSQLTAAFKQHEGCTPGVWRSKHAK